MSFVTHSSVDIESMFNELDISSYDDLFKHIPSELYLNEDIDIENSKSELELIQLTKVSLN